MADKVPAPTRPGAVAAQTGSSTVGYGGIVQNLNDVMGQLNKIGAPSAPDTNVKTNNSYDGQSFTGMTQSAMPNAPSTISIQNEVVGQRMDKDVHTIHEGEFVWAVHGFGYKEATTRIQVGGVVDTGANARGMYLGTSGVNHLLYTQAAKFQDRGSILETFKPLGVLLVSGNAVPSTPQKYSETQKYQSGTVGFDGELPAVDYWRNLPRKTGSKFGFRLQWFQTGRLQNDPVSFENPTYKLYDDDDKQYEDDLNTDDLEDQAAADYDKLNALRARRVKRLKNSDAEALIRSIGPKKFGTNVPASAYAYAETQSREAQEINRAAEGYWNFVPVSYCAAGRPPTQGNEAKAKKQPFDIVLGMFASTNTDLSANTGRGFHAKSASASGADGVDLFTQPLDSKTWSQHLKIMQKVRVILCH